MLYRLGGGLEEGLFSSFFFVRRFFRKALGDQGWCVDNA
jgi:hypothetical protein